MALGMLTGKGQISASFVSEFILYSAATKRSKLSKKYGTKNKNVRVHQKYIMWD